MRLLSLFRGSRSASSSETAFSDGPRSDSRTTVGEQTESASSGPTLLRLGSPKSFPAIAHLPETRQIVVKQVIKDVFDSTFFSICKINKLLEAVGVTRDTEAYRLLATLHCVDYNKMLPELRERLPYLINECLMPPDIVDEVEIALRGYTGD